eukprot:Nk52_evm19s32 gene=Nk52_evmTU19s32
MLGLLSSSRSFRGINNTFSRVGNQRFTAALIPTLLHQQQYNTNPSPLTDPHHDEKNPPPQDHTKYHSNMMDSLKATFESDGFIVIPDLLPTKIAHQCSARIEPLFSGDFSTGVYPDEWTWRPDLCRDDVTREICNAWKSDVDIARVVLSPLLGRCAAELCGWPGARIAQDDIWWKPPGAKAISYHRDFDYFDFIYPQQVVTCWIALEDTDPHMGTLEYVTGSHRWANADTYVRGGRLTQGFHAPRDGHHRNDCHQAALEAIQMKMGNNTDVDGNQGHVTAMVEEKIHKVHIPAGGAAFHHAKLWHGSGANEYDPQDPDPSQRKARKALAVHFIPSDARFDVGEAEERKSGGENNTEGVKRSKKKVVGYTYGRYKFNGSSRMDEQFFPVTWSRDGYRTAWLDEYISTGVLS